MSKHVDFAALADEIDIALPRTSRAKGGRSPCPAVLMTKILILQQLYYLADDALEYQLLDRRSFLQFLGLTESSTIPDAKTIWLFRDRLADLCDFQWIVCATPSYLERHGIPAMPADLAAHHWLGNARYTTDSATGADTLPVNMLHVTDATGAAETVAVSVRIGSNNQLSLQQMCEQGLGLARLGHADVAPLLKRGALVQVLPQWRFGPMPVNAVTQRREGEPLKVGSAIDAFKRYFSTL